MRRSAPRRRGDASIISTLLMMVITMLAISITLSYVENALAIQSGQNEFNLAQVFMNTLGLQVNDVAWLQGQTDAVQYSSSNAQMRLETGVIQYQLSINYVGSSTNVTIATYPTNVFFYCIPTTTYSMGNSYFQEINPSTFTTLVQNNTASSVTRVFSVQQNPIQGETDYLRIGVAPIIRSVYFSLSNATNNSNYVRLYIPQLIHGVSTPSNPQYVTLTGEGVSTNIFYNVQSLSVNLSFPSSSAGFNNNLFQFPQTHQKINFGSSGAELDLYSSTVELDYLTS